jgi:hypothetical protein
MKRRILVLLLLTVSLVLGAVFVNPVHTFAESAGSYCSGEGYSDQGTDKQEYTDCESHYTQGQDKIDVSVTCPSSMEGWPSPGAGDTGSGTQFFECESDWAAGAGQQQPDASNRGNEGTLTPCEQNFTGSYLSGCNSYAAKAKAGQTLDCGSNALCQASAALVGAKTKTPLPGGNRGDQPSAAAQQDCQGQTGQDYNGCVSGYDGHGCSSYSGSALAACNKGTSDAKAAAPNPGNASNSLGCTIQLTNPLTWVICPIVDALSQFVQTIDNLITQQLDISPSSIFCSTDGATTCGAYYNAWQSFRDIALGLLVVVALIIVSAEALGSEILDAYTIRKTLPRLLVAAIGITISWPLMNFAVTASDVLGIGIRHIIYFPFTQIKDAPDLSFGGDALNFLFGSGALVGGTLVAVPAWIVFGGPAALFSLVATAALAVLVAFVVLILRQIAIILLILISPLAILAYILPYTNRLYKLWWESFSKALLMFPMIAGFIAIGRVFAAVSFNTGGAIQQFIGFIAYFAPYFMIPMTFRFAGSAVNGLGNFVNSRAAGGFQALRGVRANQRQSRLKRARSGGLYRGANKLTRGLNKVGNYTLDADEQLAIDMGTGTGVGRLTGRAGKKLFQRRAREMGEQIAAAQNAQTGKGAEKLNDMHYSGAYGVLGMRDKLIEGMSEESVRAMDAKYGVKDAQGNVTGWKAPDARNIEKFDEYADDLAKHGAAGSTAQHAAAEMKSHAGTLSGFALDPETQRASAESVSRFILARNGKASGEQIAEWRNQSAHAKGVPKAIAESMADYEMSQLERASQPQRSDIRHGKGILVDDEGEAYSVWSDKAIHVPGRPGQPAIAAYMSDGAAEALQTQRLQQLIASKGETFDVQAKAWQFHANKRDQNGDLTPLAKQLRAQAAYLEGIWGQNDPGGKIKLEKLSGGIDWKPGEKAEYARGTANMSPEELQRMAEGGGPQGGADPTAGGEGHA